MRGELDSTARLFGGGTDLRFDEHFLKARFACFVEDVERCVEKRAFVTIDQNATIRIGDLERLQAVDELRKTDEVLVPRKGARFSHGDGHRAGFAAFP